jgi:hypothetical protein
MIIGCDRKHSKRSPAKLPLMLLLCMRGEIGAHLPREARLRDVAPNHRHSTAVDFHHKAGRDL